MTLLLKKSNLLHEKKLTYIAKYRLKSILLSVVCGILVFARLGNVSYPFSYDYLPYIDIIEAFSFFDIGQLDRVTLGFPYVYADGVVPIEVGFYLLVRFCLIFSMSPEVIYAMIAAASVGLRVYVMKQLNVPLFWIVLLNVIFITLFEANALRLGVAASCLLAGILSMNRGGHYLAAILILLSVMFHLQTLIFIIPFIGFYTLSWWIVKSRAKIIFFFVLSVLASFGIFLVLPTISNEKLQLYMEMGGSSSSGLTVTSFLASIFLIMCAREMPADLNSDTRQRVWASVAAATVPSVIVLMFLTNAAVIGDRAWQLAFLIIGSFYLSNWKAFIGTKWSYFLLFALAGTMLLNVGVRYPLSNFFSPPLPEVGSVARI